jgi:hypothetical protein
LSWRIPLVELHFRDVDKTARHYSPSARHFNWNKLPWMGLLMVFVFVGEFDCSEMDDGFNTSKKGIIGKKKTKKKQLPMFRKSPQKT